MRDRYHLDTKAFCLAINHPEVAHDIATHIQNHLVLIDSFLKRLAPLNFRLFYLQLTIQDVEFSL